MKSKKNTIIVLIVLGIIITIQVSIINVNYTYVSDITINNDNNSEVGKITDLKAADYWDENDVAFIHIKNDNWSDGSFPWIDGGGSYLGTPEDPHIIENVTINGQSIRTCITIEDSGEHFIIQNCTLYNSGTGIFDAGIFLTKVENGTILNNNISYNNKYGILVWDCNNTDISDNILNNNTKDGIYIGLNCNYHNIINNTVKYNEGDYGINIQGNFINISKNVVSHNEEGGIGLVCYYTNVSDNTVNFNGGDGIKADGCDQINISGNLVCENDYFDLGLFAGIKIRSSNNTHISHNKVNNTGEEGIYMENSNYNNITKNTINNNNVWGIRLFSSNNTYISQNKVNNNHKDGIYMQNSNYNNVTKNTINSNVESGIQILMGSNFNWISRNIINNNTKYGIYMGPTNNYNNISGNTFNTNGYTGICIAGCNYTNICGNLVYENGWGIGGFDVEGIYVEGSNNIVGGNYLKNNKDIGIEISSEFALVDSEHNIVVGNTLINNNITITEGLFQDVEDTIISCNKFIDDLFVELTSMFFSTEIFNISFRVVDKNRYGINGANIQLWWDGRDVSTNITEVGNGIYNVSMTPIPVSPVENPILLNMTVSAQYYYEKYYEIDISVDPDVIDKQPSPTPPRDDGDGDDGDDGEEVVISGYDLTALISTLIIVIGVLYLILDRKRRKF